MFIPFFDAATYVMPENTEELLTSELFELFNGKTVKLNTGYLIENAEYTGHSF